MVALLFILFAGLAVGCAIAMVAQRNPLYSAISLIGVFISLGGFTRDAEESARRASRRITLIDGDGFLDLWVEHYDRVDEDGRQLLPIKPVYFLDLEA